MRALTQVVLAAAEFDDCLLLTLAVALHGRNDLAAIQERRAYLHLLARTGEQNLVELDVRADIGREFLNPQNRAFADPILLSTRGDYGVHDLPKLQACREDPGIKGREVYGAEGLKATTRRTRTSGDVGTRRSAGPGVRFYDHRPHPKPSDRRLSATISVLAHFSPSQ